MSIISCVYVPEGIAMASDSRLTGYRSYPNGTTDRYSLSDNSQKLFVLEKSKVGVSWCGNAFINDQTIADFIRVFEIRNINHDDTVIDVANKLHTYLNTNHPNINTYFYVCGFLNDEEYIFTLGSDICLRKNINDQNKIAYGYVINGDYDAVSRLLLANPETPINFKLMPLRDAIDFSEFLVELVIKYQRFEDRVATCGGPIDLLVITKDYEKFIRHKILNP